MMRCNVGNKQSLIFADSSIAASVVESAAARPHYPIRKGVREAAPLQSDRMVQKRRRAATKAVLDFRDLFDGVSAHPSTLQASALAG
jgi:hypothetical protein